MLQSTGLFKEDSKGSIWDAWDKKIEQNLRLSHESLALAISSSATASIVARPAIVWGKKLLDIVPDT